jgi:hypothetical protein
MAILIFLFNLPLIKDRHPRSDLEGWSQLNDTESNDTESDNTDGQDSTKSPDLKELFSPRDDEYWLAGEEYSKTILSESSTSDLLLVAFWDRSDPATFYLADALKSRSTQYAGTDGDPEILAVELPEDSALSTTSATLTTTTKHSRAVRIPSNAWGVSAPIFFDSSFRVWKALGSPHWPGVTLIDRKTRKVVRSWSARTFINETNSALMGPRKTANRNQLQEKSGPGADSVQNKPLSQNVELTHTLFGKDSFVMDALMVNGQYFLVDAVANRVLQVSGTGEVIASFGNGNPGFVDGPADSAQFRFPHRIQYCASKNLLIVADWGNRAIRGISLETGAVTTLIRNDQPEDMLPTELMMIGNRLLVSGAFDNKLAVLEFTAEQELTKKTVSLPRNWLKTSILKSSSDEVAYLNDSASDKLRLLNLANLIHTQIEAGSLRSAEHQSLRTSARRTTVLRDHAISLSASNNFDQVNLAMRAVGSDTTEVYQPRPAELATITGISASNQQGLAWDAVSQRICTVALQNQPLKGEGKREGLGLSLINCFQYQAGPVALAEATDSEPRMIMKAGTTSEVTLSFALAKDEFFSRKDLHLIRTPDNQIYSWSPSAAPNFYYRAPEKAGPASFEFSPVICKNSAPDMCRRIHRKIIVEIRTSYTDAHASLVQRLQL